MTGRNGASMADKEACGNDGWNGILRSRFAARGKAYTAGCGINMPHRGVIQLTDVVGHFLSINGTSMPGGKGSNRTDGEAAMG